MNERPRKVLQLIDTLEFGGAQKIIYQLAVPGNSGRFEATVCGWTAAGPYEALLVQKGVRVHPPLGQRRSMVLAPLFLYDVCRILLRLRAIIRREGADLVHAHLPDSTMVAVLVGWLTRTPVVVTVHNNTFFPTMRFAPLRNAIRRWALRTALCAADRVIVVGADVRDTVLELMGGTDRVSLVMNGVDCARFGGSSERGELIKQRLGLPANATVLTTVGRLVSQKGQMDLLEAAARLVARFPTLHVVIAGDGPLEDALRGAVERMGLTEVVHLLGRRDDVPDILAITDVFVLPSVHEGLPLALLEAMAAGRPVVATDIPGVREVFVDGVEGFLVLPGAIDALADRIGALLADPALAGRMGERGAETVRARFSLEQMLTGVERVYEEALAER